MPKLTKLWTGTNLRIVEGQTIRADFDNDRHYEVVISSPRESKQVAIALFEMASMIAGDPLLKN